MCFICTADPDKDINQDPSICCLLSQTLLSLLPGQQLNIIRGILGQMCRVPGSWLAQICPGSVLSFLSIYKEETFMRVLGKRTVPTSMLHTECLSCPQFCTGIFIYAVQIMVSFSDNPFGCLHLKFHCTMR